MFELYNIRDIIQLQLSKVFCVHFLRICENITKKKVLMTLRVASRRIVNYNGRAITDVTTWFRKSSHGQRSRGRKLPRVCARLYMRTAHVSQSPRRRLLRKHETFGHRFIISHQFHELTKPPFYSIAFAKVS